jgi:hypothetical protein
MLRDVVSHPRLTASKLQSGDSATSFDSRFYSFCLFFYFSVQRLPTSGICILNESLPPSFSWHWSPFMFYEGHTSTQWFMHLSLLFNVTVKDTEKNQWFLH